MAIAKGVRRCWGLSRHGRYCSTGEVCGAVCNSLRVIYEFDDLRSAGRGSSGGLSLLMMKDAGLTGRLRGDWSGSGGFSEGSLS